MSNTSFTRFRYSIRFTRNENNGLSKLVLIATTKSNLLKKETGLLKMSLCYCFLRACDALFWECGSFERACGALKASTFPKKARLRAESGEATPFEKKP